MQKHTIQLISPSSLPVGAAAFLASDDLILTCAHVVTAAGSAPGDKIPLRTPNGTQLTATVERETWRDENHEDIATLRLDKALMEMKPLPLGASSASKGHSFSTYGFPKPDQSLSGSGRITGRATINGIELLQLESAQVTPGFSGAPVYDEVTKRVIGMVVAIAPPDEYQRQGTTAFAIPTETLRAACPELRLSEICPYRSLDAFTETDAHLFFGRERVITKLLDSLKRNPRFLAVLGPSGSGKSSVVQAGLIPALRQGNLLGSERWDVLSIRPGTQPFEQLASLGMSDPAVNLVKSAESWLTAHPKRERLLIIIDQFEELLVSTPANLRAEFIKSLADLLDSSVAVSIVLTLRDDFYGRFIQEAENLVGWMESATVNIPAKLEEGELREMIERPARDLGLRFASGLVPAILADARTADPSGRSIRSTILPLLEFALTQLWESREDGELTHESYRKMGGVTGGLSQWADRAYCALNDAERTVAQRIFSELVTLGDETQGIADTRRVRNLDELIAIDDAIASDIIAKLVIARLLVTRHDESSDADTVEIIHETLLHGWGLLGNWLQDDRIFLLWREGLRTAQLAWKESGFDAGALLRGVPLAEAENWLEKRMDDLEDAQKEYIKKSRLVLNIKRLGIFVSIFFVAILFTLSITGQIPKIIHRPLPITWIEIPKGRFLMGSSDEDIENAKNINPFYAIENERPQHLVYIDAYQIGQYEVTNLQYRQCVKATICNSPADNPNFENPEYDHHPVVGVNWADATTFCNWGGGRLPTEAEWEKATLGSSEEGSETFAYPWGNTWDTKRANAGHGEEGELKPVGSYSPGGDSIYGVSDLSGNAWEWVADWYSEYRVSRDETINPQGPETGEFRILRGGSTYDHFIEARTTFRLYYRPSFSYSDIGFRCAKSQ